MPGSAEMSTEFLPLIMSRSLAAVLKDVVHLGSTFRLKLSSKYGVPKSAHTTLLKTKPSGASTCIAIPAVYM